jgi:uncharacterized SAM-binding protein YcdF (DUF218 family)
VFALKSFLREFVYPLNAWVLISLVGIILCIWKPRRFAGTLVLLMTTVGLFVTACPVTGYLLLGALEGRAGTEPNLQAPKLRAIRYVVVIGNAAEGARLWKRLPGTTLVISSGSFTAEMVKRAWALGVPDTAIIVESEGRDTQEQAARLKPIVGNEPFILSTWALHMPRTLLIFEKQGLKPVPAPSDFLSHVRPSPRWFWPSTSGMVLTRIALHELVGTLWVLAQSAFNRS